MTKKLQFERSYDASIDDGLIDLTTGWTERHDPASIVGIMGANLLNTWLIPRLSSERILLTRALIHGRNAVIPEHVQAIFPSVLEHRVHQRGNDGIAVNRLLEAVPVP